MSSTMTPNATALSQPVLMHHDRIRDRLIRSQLDKDRGRLFAKNPTKELLKFWESHPDSDEFISHETRDTKSLRESLNGNGGGPDHAMAGPTVRHVFLSAGNSQKPLDCTPESFDLLSEYHRIPAEFSQMLLSFGQPVAADFVAFHQPRCHLEIRPPSFSSLSSPSSSSPSSRHKTPEGWEMRNCYKLSAMESRAGNSWSMRQMAAFHSLDLAAGRSFTLTVKANNSEIASRIQSLPLGGKVVPATVAESLEASLETQLLHYGWCVEGWASYINSLEQKIRHISDKIVAIPMQSEEKMVKRLTKLEDNATQEALPLTAVTGQNDLDDDKNHHPLYIIRRWIQEFLKRAGFSGANPITTDIPMRNVVTAGAQPPPASSNRRNGETSLERLKKTANQQLEDLRAFPFNGIQTLHEASTKLREAKLVMELNRGVLREIREHYHAVFSSENDEIPSGVKSECSMLYRGFQQRTRYLENLLLTECLRIDALTQVASDGHGLYGSILQLQGGQIGQLFAVDAQETSARMELVTREMQEIARNTEKDTASMHVITFLALIFLPGTFLGVRLYYYYYQHSRHSKSQSPSYLTASQSFFSTPIFEGQTPEGSENPSRWSFNGELFGLFARICLPMMVVVLVLWGGWTWRVKRRSSRKVRGKGDDDQC